MPEAISPESAYAVRDTCLCFAAQRAARILARRFDAVFAGLGITNNQFSLMMMMLSDPKPPLMTRLAPALAMDRTTLTAALKALERRGFVTVRADDKDRRGRRASLTTQGHDILATALPIWCAEHAALEAGLPPSNPRQLRDLLALLG